MGPGNYKPRHNNYQPLRDQEQKTEREATERTTAEKQAERETTEQATASEKRNNEPQRNDRSLLDRMPGGPHRGGMPTHNTYANWQVRVSHAQRMEREASEAASQERMPARERIEQGAAVPRETPQDRTPAHERVEQSASEQRAPETAVDHSRSKDIER